VDENLGATRGLVRQTSSRGRVARSGIRGPGPEDGGLSCPKTRSSSPTRRRGRSGVRRVVGEVRVWGRGHRGAAAAPSRPVPPSRGWGRSGSRGWGRSGSRVRGSSARRARGRDDCGDSCYGRV